jgi:hypothetical protein
MALLSLIDSESSPQLMMTMSLSSMYLAGAPEREVLAGFVLLQARIGE